MKRNELLEQIAKKAEQVLDLQKVYFRQRDVFTLNQCKEKEAELRKLLNDLKKIPMLPQPDLFTINQQEDGL